MRPILLCVFAHPDDESFGPSGTIYSYAKTHDVYIICVTNGDAGENHKKHSKLPLGKIRQRELKASAKFLGVRKVYFFDYHDGSLNNLLYHEISHKIQHIANRLKPQSLLTFEPRGISGHIDHIAVSMMTSYVFQKTPFIKTLLYFCITIEQSKTFGEYFVYRPPGYHKNEITKVVPLKDLINIKRKAMLFHTSQIHDVNKMLKRLNIQSAEHFIELKK